MDSSTSFEQLRAIFYNFLNQYRNEGYTQVKVISLSGQALCAVCAGALDRVHPIGDVPPLPHETCTCVGGCECAIVPVYSRAAQSGV